MYIKSIAEEEQAVVKSLRTKNTEPRREMIDIFTQVREILVGPKIYVDADDEDGDETDDNEQPDTTDMPDLESEESAEQRRNQNGQGLKILTPNQMLSRLPITLAQ